MKVVIATWAQNATPVHAKFWAALQQCREFYDAALTVIPGRYRNPTSQWSEAQEHDEWWGEEVTSYIKRSAQRVCANLRIHGEISIQPTAALPLTGFEAYLGESSGIFGHPSRALETVACGGRMPRTMQTTGACTVPNYTDSKAGKKGERHHVLGAVIVEVVGKLFWTRHVTANADGSFTDLGTTFTPEGAFEAERPAALTLGDYHNGRGHAPTLAATERMIAALRPRVVYLHDFLDFRSRNHHDTKKHQLFSRVQRTVKDELVSAARELTRLSASHPEVDEWRVVASNHDEAFNRWGDEHDDRLDPLNAPYHHEVLARAYASMAKTGKWPNLFEQEARHFGVPKNVKFLSRKDPSRVLGVANGFHGDRGPMGSRGSIQAFARLGTKCTIGHGHRPTERWGAKMVGLTGDLDQGYNEPPDTSLHAHCILHADSKRQMVIVVDGMYCGGDT